MPRLVLAVVAVGVLSACELEEITVVDVEEVVLAEVYANVATDFADNQLLALLHQTVGSEDVDAAEAGLVGARITVRRASDGLTIRLRNAAITDCLEVARDDLPEACFRADSADASRLRPRDLLTLDIELVDGARMEGETRVPGSFEIPGVPPQCRLAPDTLFRILWTRAEGAWAYVNETAVSGLPDALRSEGIVLREDPLYLLGLSVSATDTTTTFPSEFGVFNRFDLDQQVAVRLQRGLPAEVSAEITVTAVDRNYVNWARGGNFNPSGQVRVPSLRGDGSGVFASTVGRRLLITTARGSGLPACPLGSG